MPVKFSAKQIEELFTKGPKASRRTPAIFEDDILALKVGEAIWIDDLEWKTATDGKELNTLPIHYRGKFNEKYGNNFLDIKKVAASERTNNKPGYLLTRVDPATKTKKKSKKK